ncbi:MAG: hypothetical protein ACR2IR_10960 [Acidimicrobiia bacterium]
MGFLDRFTKKDSLKEGLPGTAVLRSKPKWRVADDQNPHSLTTFSWPLGLDLEVRVEGREPYTASQEFKVPKRWYEISTGVEVPVRVDPGTPDRILIDWDAFAAAGGEQLVKERGAHNQREANYKAVSGNTAARQAMQNTVKEWLGAVKAGGMSVQDFNGYIDEHVDQGYLTAEEGQAAKAQAAG